MRRLPIGCLACLFLLLVGSGAPAQWYSPPTEARKRLVRLQRTSTGPELKHAEAIFPRWMSAVQAHAPGKNDSAARAIATWSGADLDSVLRWVLFQFTAGERALRGRDALTKARLAELVKRGAVMHFDIALTATPDSPHRSFSPLPSSPIKYFILEFTDGREARGYHASVHLEVGRALLALMPKQLRDPEFMSLWYQATSSIMLLWQQLGYAEPHVAAALDELPDNARLTFYAAAVHEEYATLRFQHGMDTPLPAGFLSSIKPVHEELERADKLLTRAVRLTGADPEVRLHHARVAGLLGRHADAAAELAAIEPALIIPELRYYAALFRGAEEEALGRPDAARVAYERAAALFPAAQSPLIALSRLARSRGDRRSSVTALRRVFALPTPADARIDPWWIYPLSPVRDATALVTAVWDRVPRGATP